MLKLTLCALLMLDLVHVGLALRPLAQERPDSASALPPLYVTIITHDEEPIRTRPDYLANRNLYIQNRALVARLSGMVAIPERASMSAASRVGGPCLAARRFRRDAIKKDRFSRSPRKWARAWA